MMKAKIGSPDRAVTAPLMVAGIFMVVSRYWLPVLPGFSIERRKVIIK